MVSIIIILSLAIIGILVAYRSGKRLGSARTADIYKNKYADLLSNSARLKNDIESLAKTIDNQKCEISHLNNDCRIFQGKNISLQKELSNLKSAHDSLINMYTVQVHKNDEIEKTRKQLSEKYDELCKNYDELNANYNKILLDKEQSALYRLKPLLDENYELSSMVDGLNAYLTEYSNSADEEIRDKDSEIAQLTEQLNQATNQYNELRLTRFQNLVQNSILYPYVKDSLVYGFINYTPLAQKRLFNYLDDQKNHPDYKVLSIDVLAKIRGSNNNIYQTSLNNCTCPDHRKHSDIPCKHMYRLAHMLALFNDLPSKEIDREIRDVKRVNEEYKHLLQSVQKIKDCCKK